MNGEGAFTLLRCTDGASFSVPQVYDRNASTSTENAFGNQLTYNFQEPQYLKSVLFYNDPSTTASATIEVTSDGTEWKSVGGFTSSIQEVDLTDIPNTSAVRVTWTGDAAPSIYEIVENADKENPIKVTEIKEIKEGGISSSANGASIRFFGNQLRAEAPSGIIRADFFSTTGSLVMTQNCGGEQSVNMPLTHVADGVLIVKLTLQNGNVRNFKISVTK